MKDGAYIQGNGGSGNFSRPHIRSFAKNAIAFSAGIAGA